MKKIYFILFATFVITSLNATNFFIVPGPGNVWTPTLTTVNIGDVVQFGVSTTHPASEVSQATWMANGTATLSTGFGTKTTSYSFTITALTTNTIYFVCPNHVAMGMKGMIVKAGSTGLSTINNPLTQISLFPNPTSNEVNIAVPSNLSDVSLKLIGVNGQEIELTSSSQISSVSANTVYTAILPSSIGNGVYFIEVSTANERVYKKVVITK